MNDDENEIPEKVAEIFFKEKALKHVFVRQSTGFNKIVSK